MDGCPEAVATVGCTCVSTMDTSSEASDFRSEAIRDVTDAAEEETAFSIVAQPLASWLEYQYANAPINSRRSNSTRKPMRLPVGLRFSVRVGTGEVDEGSSEPGAVLAVVFAAKRTPENLPLQPQQYLARSLFAVWHASQNFIPSLHRSEGGFHIVYPCLGSAFDDL
ncbi:hypothetical protein QTH97_31680 [Variovorax sp. J22R24]|uniref:hypothetical protein n=1 Tax=Variovorax gracilis TaxID=3053502 RepID=UPI0025759FC6|nr:hypothetical protein [Variovorax sp. J22R24]MDM0109524.1 hypothetical protein [Variovorax sp. J22R24]